MKQQMIFRKLNGFITTCNVSNIRQQQANSEERLLLYFHDKG